MKDRTLCILIRQNKILLGMKKRGFGEGNLNGFGGKLNKGESIKQAALRELYEEIGIKAKKENLKKVAEIEFVFPFAVQKEWNQLVHVFLVNEWNGRPKESEEMGVGWFDITSIPYERMWDDDKHWLPLILSGKTIKARFSFDKENKYVKSKEIEECSFEP
ncbi:8-oxo-dGTP diphosphatase [archaeon]|nr:8-oxo-dGTP diphosphatase [archaeon]